MSERRKWDKQPPVHEPFAAGGHGGAWATSDAASDPVLEKQVQYIKMLEERNRLKKKLAVASKKDTREKQREDAFVTTFNVPTTAAATASSSAVTTGSAQETTVRKNKSSASLLPTKMHTLTSDADRSRGRSAPSTALPLRMTPRMADDDEHDSEAKPELAVRRAKWSKPMAGEAFGVENRHGKARLCVGAKDDETSVVAAESAAIADQSGDDDFERSDEEYLEESFEAFERADELEEDLDTSSDGSGECKARSHKVSASFPAADVKPFAVMTAPTKAEGKERPVIAVSTADASSSAGLSRTTTDLFSVIQNLSRSKQKALVDVLNQFESSAQQDRDVQTMQSSIGDPAIWKQVSTALFRNAAHDEKNSHQSSPSVSEVKQQPALTIAHVMEDQRKWEEEYARQMQRRLAEERESKEKAVREAEQRRLLLMQQMEEEEKELERLMEQKRLQRLAKLKALEQEEDAVQSVVNREEAKRTEMFQHEAKPVVADVSSRIAGGKLIPETTAAPEDSEYIEGLRLVKGAAEMPSALLPRGGGIKDSALVPTLDLSNQLHSPGPTKSRSLIVELRIRLMSTWGKTRAVGLTQICAYDASGVEIEIDVGRVKLYEQADGRALPKSHEMMRSIPRLFNGVAQTNNDDDMWLGHLSGHGTLEIALEFDTPPSKLCVWNYNSKMCTACARDVEVLVGGKSVWSGSLPQGFGDEDDNLCTWISVGQIMKKTARTVASRSNADHEKLVPSVTRPTNSTDEAKVTIPTTATSHGGPIWLAASTSTGSISTTKAPPTKADAKETLLYDLDGQTDRTNAPGNLTSRRQRGNLTDTGTSLTTPRLREDKFDSQESKIDNRSESIRSDAFLARKERERLSGPGALTSSWDSLEHFSKTSQSRLPYATEESPLTATPRVSVEDPTKARFVQTTTSSLLAELRGTTTYASSSPVAAVPTNEGLTSVHVPIAIPELPSGRRLKLEIVSTWGDQYYVGLNGVEIFDHRGKLVTFANSDRQIVACPSSINVLDEYDDDPRVAKNLVDGVNCTCDDFHMWLAPYAPAEEHHVLMLFEQTTSISMVRVWNYNKSRAHTSRGVRQIRLFLLSDTTGDQGRLIFEGEIRRAPGSLVRDDDSDNAMWCEVILFTMDQSILRRIEANDALLQAYGREQEGEEATSAIVSNVRSSMELRRPKTADTGSEANNSRSSRCHDDEIPASVHDTDRRRPITSAKRLPHNVDVRKSVDSWVTEEPQQKSPVLTKVTESKEENDEEESEGCEGLVRGRRIVLRLLSTWGDRNYIGLTQLDVLVGHHGTPIALDISNIDATPRDLATLGYDGDPRTLDKLINGIGTTCDDDNMWLVPFGSTQEIRIDLKREQSIYGIRVWNYNKSLEDSFRGVKQLAVAIDGELISPRHTGYVLRKAPGTACFDFDQILRFGSSDLGDKRDRAYVEKVVYPIQSRVYKSPNVKQDYEPVLYPQGLVLKFVLWATWGDPYYVGLNGIELYDAHGKSITSRPSIITAQPHSLADIDQQASPQDDVRVPENLLSGKNKNTWDASDAWLAPLASSLGNPQGNVVYVVFDTPIVLSLIKFWNYSKTPDRGVKELDIYLDDLHIFSGTLRKAPHGNGGQNVGRFGPKQLVVEEFSQPVLFSTNQAQVDAEKRRVHYCGTEEQDVLCINEGQVVQESKAMYRKPDPGAEGVVVDLGQRPMTAMSRK